MNLLESVAFLGFQSVDEDSARAVANGKEVRGNLKASNMTVEGLSIVYLKLDLACFNVCKIDHLIASRDDIDANKFILIVENFAHNDIRGVTNEATVDILLDVL